MTLRDSGLCQEIQLGQTDKGLSTWLMLGMSIIFSSMVYYHEMIEKQNKQKCDPLSSFVFKS